MPPKDKEILKEKEVLQAVVVDDLLSPDFPFSGPKGLLRLANVRLLDYTLASLSAAGVEQTLVYAAQGSEQLQEHVKASGWGEPGVMAVQVVACQGSLTFGDLMRELDARNAIQGDFFLLTADTVCTADLRPLLLRHRATCARDKNAVVTLAFAQAEPQHAARTEPKQLLLGTAATGRVLAHQRLDPDARNLDLPLDLILQGPGLELRYDLSDPCLAVCSLAVPPIFSDNFDFQTRDDFVRGLLLNEDILGHTMYAHILQDEYASRAHSLPSYLATSVDVIRRWTFPLTPDASLSQVDRGYRLDVVSNVCKQSDVSIGRSDVEDCVIGEGSVIGDNCRLRLCVIGKKCVIQDDVDLCGAVLWDHCVVKKGFKKSHFLAPERTELSKNNDKSISVEVVERLDSVDSDTDSSEDEGDAAVEVDEYENFFNEVQDSLERGFREKVNTDDLVVEINSSRFANDIPANEVSLWVSKVVLGLPAALKKPPKDVLTYFRPILRKYIGKASADHLNCLLALEEVTAEGPAEAAKMLTLLYQMDVLEEDTIVEWFEESAGQQLRQQANMRKFIDWLQTAEEESD
ncbi:translation initiation factor eIF2B subunit epsilon [Cloeon dipterum]|uniref:translation initiation factor eIF2B subunit epsilon n=1 Tax=Cloeon dipterum TaxID=197152 RepID=UPI00322020CA